MNHPPYHLRPNKAVDRFLLVEMLRRLTGRCNLSEYSYFGFGGPFLEDCRLLNEHCPELSLVSLEANEHTYKRQLFHKCAKDLKLEKCNFQSFLPSFCCKGREIFWLDYTDLKMARFDEFMQVLAKGEHGTIVKITLRAQRDDNPYQIPEWLRSGEEQLEERLKLFKEQLDREFAQVLPASIQDSHFRPAEFPKLLQRMLQVAAQRTLPASCDTVFQPLHSAYYMDGTWMLSLAGIICSSDDIDSIKSEFKAWKFSNTDWDSPHHIDVPVLSVKERLLFEKLLPVKNNTGKALARALGYWIGDSQSDNLRRLQQYADFHRFYPYFAKVTM